MKRRRIALVVAGLVVGLIAAGGTGCAGTGTDADPPLPAAPTAAAGESAEDGAAGPGARAASPAAPTPASRPGVPESPRAEPVSARAEVAPRGPEDDAEFDRTFVAADRRVREFVELGAAPDPDLDVVRRRELVASALEAFSRVHVDRLLAGAAPEAEPARRRSCVALLAFANDRRATSAATVALGTSGDTSLQAAAGFALARLADPDTPTDALISAVNSPDSDVRANALIALREVFDARVGLMKLLDGRGRAQALAALRNVLVDPSDARTRGLAAAAARALGDAQIKPTLLTLLRDKDPFVRMHTALALARYGERDDVAALVAVIDDTPRGIAREAVFRAVRTIVEREWAELPADIPDDGASWSRAVDRVWTERDRRPVR